MTRSQRPTASPPRNKPDSRKELARRAGVLAQRLAALQQELQGKLSPKREAELYRTVARVALALKGELQRQREQCALVVNVVEQEGDSLRAVEHEARMTGRPSNHDPVDAVRDRISVLPGAERALDATILKAVGAWASGNRASVRWTALAELCVEIGLATSDEDLRADYAEWQRTKRKRD
jgi:hypothetical protein